MRILFSHSRLVAPIPLYDIIRIKSIRKAVAISEGPLPPMHASVHAAAHTSVESAMHAVVKAAVKTAVKGRAREAVASVAGLTIALRYINPSPNL